MHYNIKYKQIKRRCKNMSKNNKLEILFDKRFDHFNMSTQAPGFRHGEHQEKIEKEERKGGLEFFKMLLI